MQESAKAEGAAEAMQEAEIMISKLKDAGEQALFRQSDELQQGFVAEKGRLTADMEREVMREKIRLAAEERQRADKELERQKKILLGDPGNWEVTS
jgi:hypothetical protein